MRDYSLRTCAVCGKTVVEGAIDDPGLTEKWVRIFQASGEGTVYCDEHADLALKQAPMPSPWTEQYDRISKLEEQGAKSAEIIETLSKLNEGLTAENKELKKLLAEGTSIVAEMMADAAKAMRTEAEKP